jgi:hypothetical protein
MTDEFEIYDACTADTLEKHDIIQYEGNYYQVISILDNGDYIEITVYDLNWGEELDTPIGVDPAFVFSLFKYAD